MTLKRPPTRLMLYVALLFNTWAALWFMLGNPHRFSGRIYDSLRAVVQFLPYEWQIRSYGIALAVLAVTLWVAWFAHYGRLMEWSLLLVGLYWFYNAIIGFAVLIAYGDAPPITGGLGIFLAVAYYTLARRVALGQ